MLQIINNVYRNAECGCEFTLKECGVQELSASFLLEWCNETFLEWS